MNSTLKSEIHEIIYKNELILANRLTKNASNLITSDFVEFGCSGRVYQYSDIINHFKDCRPREMSVTDFNLSLLSDKIVHATYSSEIKGKKAMRSSLWRYENNTWKMFFHQGTSVD